MKYCKLPPTLGSECKNQSKLISIRGKVFEIVEHEKSFDLTLSEDGKTKISILAKRPDWLQIGQEIEINGGTLQASPPTPLFQDINEYADMHNLAKPTHYLANEPI